MGLLRCDPATDVLFVVDVQTPFLDAIHESERVLNRTKFLIGIAKLLEVPIIATEQVPEKLGETHPEVSAMLRGVPLIAKTSFSALGAREVSQRLTQAARTRAILVGVETHICVCSTAIDLIQVGYKVVVCPDAVSSRTIEAHKLGMERVRDCGAIAAHTESVAYEWLGSSLNPKFKEALELVKSHPL
jgi:nicotinamidase-related amidase